jgi:hypothetical protein
LGGFGGDSGGSAGGSEAGAGGGGSGGPDFELVTASGWAQAIVECPDDKPWVLGTGALAVAGIGLQAVVPEPGVGSDDAGLGTSTVRVEGGGAGTAKAYAVCSDAMGSVLSDTSTTNNNVVACEVGMIAVGGGGECVGGGRLFRSRPLPDTPGSKPTGWRASCSSGSTATYAICISEEFGSCHYERVSDIGNALAICPSGQKAVSAGGYCNSAQGLLSLELDPELTRVNVACVEPNTDVNAYVICCD